MLLFVVQSLSPVQIFATPWTAPHQASLPFTISQSTLSWWCYPTISSSVMLFSFCFQSFPASGTFPMSQLLPIRWPKFWSFSFSISSSNEYSGLISFRIDLFDPFAGQKTLKSLLQNHSSKASFLQCSAIFMVQISYSYLTTRKTIAWLYGSLLARWCLCFVICCLGLS